MAKQRITNESMLYPDCECQVEGWCGVPSGRVLWSKLPGMFAHSSGAVAAEMVWFGEVI
jgi:hypothetical protein